jgi:hypothetical protein
MKKSVLFINPDYHCSFLYRDEFRRLAWKADIYVRPGYPRNILYSDSDIIEEPVFRWANRWPLRFLGRFLVNIWMICLISSYHYLVYYGSPPAYSDIDNRFRLKKIFGPSYCFELFFARVVGKKLVYIPTGCNEEQTKEEFGRLDEGNVCENCGCYDRCDDTFNNLNFTRIRKYFHLVIGNGSVNSKQLNLHPMKYKAVDLDEWKPDLQVPEHYKHGPIKSIRVLHSSYLANSSRNWKGRNIKGSPHVLAAIDRLRAEGFPVEYYLISDKPSREMRYYQAQADIVVEQLIYGWWGSTGVETMALGKPVICYLRKEWKDLFLSNFPEYSDLPIVEANTETIYQVLKKLVIDSEYRRRCGEQSRRFAINHFDLEKNAKKFLQTLRKI